MIITFIRSNIRAWHLQLEGWIIEMQETIYGGCICKRVRYSLHCNPLYIHACHCSWCQRETGSAFAVNALIESAHVTISGEEYYVVDTPSESGQGQTIVRCKHCQVAVLSYYPNFERHLSFIRVGTLDRNNHFEPDVHIYVDSKAPWIKLSEGALVFREYYDREQVWPEESLERFKAVLRLKEQQ